MKFGILAALSAVTLATSAGAVTINTGVTAVAATHVRLTHSQPGGAENFIQIGEWQAFTFGGVNVAAASNGGLATGTAVFGTVTGAANDGNTNRNFGTSGSIFHSQNGVSDFLRIDFSAPATLASMVIHGRTDCCSFRDSWQVTVFAGDTSLWSGQVDAYGSIATVNFTAPPTTGAVPEPASWAMLIAGFGLVGASARRRRVAYPAAASIASI